MFPRALLWLSTFMVRCNLQFLRATAECSAHLSYGLGVRPPAHPSVCLSHCCIVSTRCKLRSRNLYCGLPRVYRDKILCSWVKGFPSKGGVKVSNPLKDVIFSLLARRGRKRLQIGTNMLLIIISTDDRFFRVINIDNLEWPWTPKIMDFDEFFAIFGCSKNELR